MTDRDLKVEWRGTGRKPQCQPNPAYPTGIDVDTAHGEPSCRTAVTYPAPCIGAHIVRCRRCGASVAVTAAGRVDDPRSVRIPCKVSQPKGGMH